MVGAGRKPLTCAASGVTLARVGLILTFTAPKSPIYHDEPDSVGIATGVTCSGGCSGTGADDIFALARQAALRRYALLNVSRVGLVPKTAFFFMANIDADAVGRR